MHRTYLFLAAALLLAVATAAVAEQPSVSQRTAHMDGRVLLMPVADTLDTRTFTPAGAAASTADLAWSNAITYIVENVFYAKPAGNADLSTLGQWPTQSNGTSRLYVFHLDAAGQVNATVGQESAADVSPAWPELEETMCPFAAALVTTTDAVQFTLGGTSFGAAGVSATFSDISALPSQALTR